MNLLKELIYRIRGEYTLEHLIKLGLKVGSNFNPQLGVSLDPSHCWLIEIGNNVTMAPHVTVLAHDASTWEFLGYTKLGKVKIGNRVFIGAESVVLPGITIGDDVIIGANSTVTHDIPAGCVYAGSPARLIGYTKDFIEKNRKIMMESLCYGEEFTLRKKVDISKKKQMQKELSQSVGFIK